MDGAQLDAWFGDYLDTFAACGRGDSQASALLAYYGVPFLFATEDRFVALVSHDDVVAAAKQQIDGIRGSGYDHSDTLASEVTILNATSALYRGDFSRRRGDGSEIGRLTATYLITEGEVGRRISAIATHSA